MKVTIIPIVIGAFGTFTKGLVKGLEDLRGCPSGVMVKAMDCGIIVREFELQSRYYVGKGINPLILPAMG